MINSYEIKKYNTEEILLLYFDLDSEFASINFKDKYNSIQKHIKKFIEDNRITFNGTIAVIVIGGTILGKVLLNNDNKIDNNTLLALESGYEEILSNDFIKENSKETILDNVIEDNNTEEISNTKENVNDNKISVITNNDNKQVNKAVIKEDNTTNVNNTVSTSVNTNTETNINNIEINETNNNYEEEEIDNHTYIKIQRSNGQIINIELEEYIAGVVSSEMPALFHHEALKAQAVISRTYALKAISKGQTLSDSNSTQSYKDIYELKSLWGSNFNTYYNKVKDAVSSTKGKYLTYNGAYIEAVYHSTSNGKTEDSSNAWGNYFPYLISVSSEYDSLNPSFEVSTTMSYEKLSSLLGMEINNDTEFNIIDKTVGGRVKSISVNDKVYTGINFRNVLGLRSADFSIDRAEDGIIFTTRGYGHGVGMSQYGANGMAKNGYSYREILSHYYPGTLLTD